MVTGMKHLQHLYILVPHGISLTVGLSWLINNFGCRGLRQVAGLCWVVLDFVRSHRSFGLENVVIAVKTHGIDMI